MSDSRGWLPEDLALLPPDPQLAATLAAVDRAALSDEDLVRLAQARQRLVAHVQAEMLADLHAIDGRCEEALAPAERDGSRWSEVEIAVAMRWTGRAAGRQLALAQDVIDRLPAVFDALHSGEIDIPKAWVICDAVIGLDTPVARRVVDQVIGEAHRWTTGQLAARLHRLVIAADPQAAARKAGEKVRGRRVTARLTDAGVAELVGHDLPPHRVAAAMERLTAIARAAKNGGDARRMDQLRADVLLDLLVGEGVATGGPVTPGTLGGDPDAAQPQRKPEPERRREAQSASGADAGEVPLPEDEGADPDDEAVAALWWAGFDQLPSQRPHLASNQTARPSQESESLQDGDVATEPREAGKSTPDDRGRGAMPGPRRGVIDLQVPLTTLMGLSDFPGELGGFGPIIADIARQVAADNHDATWRFSVYDPVGEMVAHGITGRRPTAQDAAFVKARDRTCRAPGCRVSVTGCDIDHTAEWASSKDSRRCNLACVCRKHHRYKHLTGCDLTQIVPGVLGWTTLLGQRLVTTPPTYPDEDASTVSRRGRPLCTGHPTARIGGSG